MVHGLHLPGQWWRTALHWVQANTFTPDWLPPKWRYLGIGYLLGIFSQVIAAVVDIELMRIFPPIFSESLLTALAAVLVALNWGLGPSLLTTVLGTALIYYCFVPRLLTGVIVNRPGLIGAPMFFIVGCALSISTSVTQRARRDTERVVRQLEATFAAITDAVIVYDRTGNLIQTNPAARRVLGFDIHSPYAALPLRERISRVAPRDEHGRPLALEQWPPARMLRGETLTGANSPDVIVNLPDGREAQLEVTAEPIRDAEGQLTGGVCVYRDVTERRQLERRTRNALHALLAIAETLVLMPEAASPVQEQAPEPESTSASETGKRIAELMASALGCQCVAMLALEVGTDVLHPLTVVCASHTREQAWWATRPVGIRLSDPPNASNAERLLAGETVVVDMSQPPFNERPNPLGLRRLLIAPMRVRDQLVGILMLDYGSSDHEFSQDEMTLAGAVAMLGALVIERERLQGEREEARANELAMSEANRRMQEFLSIASHELRTPLTSLQGNIQVMARHLSAPHLEGAPAEELARVIALARTMLGRSEHSLRRIRRLVDDILDDARIREGHLEAHLEPCDLVAVVREAVDEQRLQASERTIQLELPEAQPVTVRADASRIGQVVTNYLTNALKYSTEEQPVTVRIQVEDATARVSVRDEGVGLPAEEQAHIWEHFYRAKGIEVQSGSGVGMGIGLYISKSIIEGHGGQVGVHSAPGQGSTFWFTLPLAQTTS